MTAQKATTREEWAKNTRGKKGGISADRWFRGALTWWGVCRPDDLQRTHAREGDERMGLFQQRRSALWF
jgi:hypothetical protein